MGCKRREAFPDRHADELCTPCSRSSRCPIAVVFRTRDMIAAMLRTVGTHRVPLKAKMCPPYFDPDSLCCVSENARLGWLSATLPMLVRKDSANTQEHKDKYKALSERDSGFTTNFDGGFELEEHRLAHEDFTSLEAKRFDFMLRQVYLLPRTASTNLEQALYDAVHIQILHPGPTGRPIRITHRPSDGGICAQPFFVPLARCSSQCTQ
jgi:hypothetical protein